MLFHTTPLLFWSILPVLLSNKSAPIYLKFQFSSKTFETFAKIKAGSSAFVTEREIIKTDQIKTVNGHLNLGVIILSQEPVEPVSFSVTRYCHYSQYVLQTYFRPKHWIVFNVSSGCVYIATCLIKYDLKNFFVLLCQLRLENTVWFAARKGQRKRW